MTERKMLEEILKSVRNLEKRLDPWGDRLERQVKLLGEGYSAKIKFKKPKR